MNGGKLQRLYGIRFSDKSQLVGTLGKNKQQIKQIIIQNFINRYGDFSQLNVDSIKIDTTKLKFNFSAMQFDEIKYYFGRLQLFHAII